MMEMKRALTWYFVILVALAAGLYLFMELFVNKPESEAIIPDAAESAAPETAAAPLADTESSGRADLSGDVQSEDISPADSGVSAGASTGAPSSRPDVKPASTPASSSAVAGSAGGNYTVQVAALASRAKADGVVEKLRNDGFSGGRIAADMGDEFNRVWVGSFATKAEALAYAEKLKGKGYNTYVRTVQ